MNKNTTLILISALLILSIANCSTLINRMAFGPSSEIQFIEKIPFEIPPLQKIQPTKDFSFAYKVGEFSERVESIGYTDIRDNLGRNQRKQKTIYENKILEVKANRDYLLSRSWVEKEKSKCEIPNLDESWHDKNSNFLEYSRTIYNCKEYKKESNNILGNPIQKYDALTLDKPVFSEIKSEKYIAKLEIQFIGISNYRNREVALILFRIEIKAQADKCIPTNLLIDKNDKCSVKGDELIYLDLKSKVPLLRKSFETVSIEKEKSFSMLDPFGILDDFFPITTQTQSIHTFKYPIGYLK